MTLACPVCRCPLAACQHVYCEVDGIWRFIRPERVNAVETFVRDYTKIRLAEGRDSEDPDFYRNLPDCSEKHPVAWQWRMHRRTYACFRDKVLTDFSAASAIVDLGAGTGWLSNRLAKLGHQMCAVDLTCDDQDGLGAARHFTPQWLRLQAEFDYLPLADKCADAVVFNASLHYSTDYVPTLREALRVLREGGRIVVLETPVYKSESSGRRMVEERHATFSERYATPSDSMRSIEYLTWDRLRDLGRELGMRWRVIYPWYGIGWALRPFLAGLKKKREPSRFPILVARKPQVKTRAYD